MTAAAFLGATGDGGFAFGPELYGAFGGVFGGAVAAATVLAARPLAAGRVPAALDCRFLRGLGDGDARAAADVVHQGRTMTVVAVDLVDRRGKLACRATVSLVDPAVLADLETPGAPVPQGDASGQGARKWRTPPGVVAPIVDTLSPSVLGGTDEGVATTLQVPWDEDGSTSAEAACFGADLAVGPPVVAALMAAGRALPHPNPDLSLRFAGSVTGRELLAVGRLERLTGGIAVTTVRVVSGGRLVSAGTSCSLVLAG